MKHKYRIHFTKDSTPDAVTGDILSTDIDFWCDLVRIRISFSSLHLVSTPTQPNVTTVVGSCKGFCNETLSGSLTTLHVQAGIFVSNNGTLYVGDGSPVNTVFSFEPNNRTGQPIMSFSDWPAFIFMNNLIATIYVTVFFLHQVRMWPSNETIPPNTTSHGCAMNLLNYPTGLVVDSSGNVYVANRYCHWITKWAPNAASGILIVGSPSATAGNDGTHLNEPYSLSLDQGQSLLYVTDRANHRIQKFVLGNSTGVTVAGGNGPGSAMNQLDSPTVTYVSHRDGAYYICDTHNNRVQKWAMYASYGVTIAGSASGIAGNTPYLLNQPYDIWIDPDENYMLVSDPNNCRVQRYSLI